MILNNGVVQVDGPRDSILTPTRLANPAPPGSPGLAHQTA